VGESRSPGSLGPGSHLVVCQWVRDLRGGLAEGEDHVVVKVPAEPSSGFGGQLKMRGTVTERGILGAYHLGAGAREVTAQGLGPSLSPGSHIPALAAPCRVLRFYMELIYDKMRSHLHVQPESLSNEHSHGHFPEREPMQEILTWSDDVDKTSPSCMATVAVSFSSHERTASPVDPSLTHASSFPLARTTAALHTGAVTRATPPARRAARMTWGTRCMAFE